MKEVAVDTAVARQRLARSTVECLLLVCLVGAFLWRGFVPAWETLNTDFPDYYLAARLYRQGYPLEKIYDWTWVQRQKDHAQIDRPIVTFTLLTPFSLLPVLPFASFPPLVAKHGWLLANLVFLGLTGWLLRALSGLRARSVAILIFLALVPLRTNFLFGQEYILLLLLLTLAAFLHWRQRPVASGLTLAVAAALKIYPGLFILFFARKKQWTAALSLLLGSFALWTLSIVLFGFETVRIYLLEVMPWALRAEGQDPYNFNWNSFSALLHRLFIAEPDLNPHPLIHLPAAYAFLQPVCQGLIFVPFLWLLTSSRADSAREKLEWGAFVAMLLILSTNPASYDFNGLILTAALGAGYLTAARRRREAAALLVLYTLVCSPLYRWVPAAPTGWRILLGFPRLWAMTALWVFLLFILARSAPEPLGLRLQSREAKVFAGLWLTLVGLGVSLTWAQLRSEFNNYAWRLPLQPGALLATDPAVAGQQVLSTTMTSRGYATAAVARDSLVFFAFPGDSFHPASAPGSTKAWVELVSGRSRIIRFSLEGTTPAGEEISEAEDAESPAVSPDGRWLAFIRETKGRGELWIKQLQPDSVDATAPAEKRLSPAGLDVLDAAFDASDRVIFSARRGGRPMLFTAGAASSEIAALGWRAPRRYPAVSPDRRWLAFSELQGNYWQLGVEDLETHAERRLTQNDCNSIAPAWYPDSKHLVYASDCARGYGLTALCRIEAVP